MSGYFLLFLCAILVFEFHIQPTFAEAGGIKCREEEKQALLIFKKGLQDKGMLSTWRDHEDADCCNWKRVQCDNQTGHVTMLHLRGTWEHYLIGAINVSLTELQHLTDLDLSFNDFQGSQIPIFIGSLRSLIYLNLSFAGFGGTIPHQFGMLSHLQYLDLSLNYELNGTIPYQLGMLLHLQYLNLNSNQLDGAIPHQLEMLPHLQYLDLSHNYELNGAIPYQLGMLSHLQYLDLSSNQLAGAIPYQLRMISHLQYLDLSSNQLDGAIPYQLGMLPHLQYLDLSSNQLEGTIPYQLGNLSQLVHLDLSNNFLEGVIPFHFGNFSTLKFLNLGYNNGIKICEKNHGDTIKLLSSLSSLTDLDLSGLLNLNHSNHWIQLISILPSLRNLYLASTGLSDTNILFPSNSHLNFSSSLSFIDISENMFTSSKIFQCLLNCTTNLRELHLSGNLLKDPILDNFDNMFFLKYLDLSNNVIEILKFIGNWTSSLHELDLAENFLKGSILDDFDNMSSLKLLDLSDNNLEGAIPKFIQNCTSNLRKLYLSNNFLKNLNPNDFNNINSLEYLNLSGNNLEGEIAESIGNICTLQELRISKNHLNGGLSSLLHNSSGCIGRALQILDLSENQLNGEIPKAIKSLTSLEYLDLYKNSLEGIITDVHFTNLSKLMVLDLSYNPLILNFSDDWIPTFQLRSLYVGSTMLGPGFPKWLQNHIYLSILDISDANITDLVPKWFWVISQNMSFINISCNNLKGVIPNLPLTLNYFPDYILTSNQFEGSLPPFLLGASTLRLSKNNFSDLNLFSCDTKTPENDFLEVLDLSSNQLLGQMSNCWNHLKSLVFLDLSNNKLSGKIPTSLGALINLEALVLRSNSLVGELPSSLKNCTKLLLLDVGQNKLSGSIPSWIGMSLQQLTILSVRLNYFNGSLPLSLCYLQKIQVLDLSQNRLSKGIPRCLQNLTSMAQQSINSSLYYATHYINHSRNGEIDFRLFMMWKGAESEFKKPDLLLKSIDLSSNHLSSEIPIEIGDLLGLVSLNLSRNNLCGQVTPKIGNLESLEFLDLSRNNLSGEIPSSLAQIDRLAELDVSNNRLCGKIPIGTQLQSFNASSYEENLCLCGEPLDEKCPEVKIPTALVEDKNEKSAFMEAFYMSMGLGFPVGFWGLLGPILVKQSWRHAYLRFLNNLLDSIYVTVQ